MLYAFQRWCEHAGDGSAVAFEALSIRNRGTKAVEALTQTLVEPALRALRRAHA